MGKSSKLEWDFLHFLLWGVLPITRLPDATNGESPIGDVGDSEGREVHRDPIHPLIPWESRLESRIAGSTGDPVLLSAPMRSSGSIGSSFTWWGGGGSVSVISASSCALPPGMQIQDMASVVL